MVEGYEISESEATDRVNERFISLESIGENFIYHEPESYWVRDILFGHDVWWKDNESFSMVKAVPAISHDVVHAAGEPTNSTPTRPYDAAESRRWLRARGIAVRIVRNRIETSDRLGRHRWVIEPTFSWLTGYLGYHRLNIRYDRKASHFIAFLTLAAAFDNESGQVFNRVLTRDIKKAARGLPW